MRTAINGQFREVDVDNRTTLLDLLREQLALTGTKKGCDHGQCGACTVLLNGERALSCLRLAVTLTDEEVTTIEGLCRPQGRLSALQESFVAQDALQCGYCTPGQVCSAVGALAEAGRGWPSRVTPGLTHDVDPDTLSRAEIAERLSGNLCRCGAYPRIVDAVRAVLPSGDTPVPPTQVETGTGDQSQ
ncbi:2Fe-2S iron-sulfur cluster-binding protein [Streptomyces sp. NPDC048212]|uniref:(2Fe-2S)-binding protein n=1 Tax=Streptomyces sp. NPDC048212 TaxID=3156658 RepID=UPI0033F805EE